MALIQMNFLSETLMRTVPVHVVLPVDKMPSPDMPAQEEKPYKTLYLLHGIFGNYTDWVSFTRIQRLAEDYNVAVVMPSGDNSFYLDQPGSHNYYGEFVGRELVEMTRKAFPLSRKREDTYIGGLSMGGYGAIRNGLKYHDTFGAIVALSASMIIEDLSERTNDSTYLVERRDYAEAIFGDLEQVVKSDKNPKYLIEKLQAEGAKIPAIYMACGKEDRLLAGNRDFAEFLKKRGVEVTLEEGPGGHEWNFWDTYIKKGLEWLPLEHTGSGINSGNVGI